MKRTCANRRGRTAILIDAVLFALAMVGAIPHSLAIAAEALPEYRLKAAFIYNFAVFTEWPASVGNKLNLCVHGPDPFAGELSNLDGKAVGARSIAVQRTQASETLADCHIVFVAAQTLDAAPALLQQLQGRPVLTISDSAGALRRGIALNLNLAQSRVTFEANLAAARASGLKLSSKLLNLATEVLE